MANSVGQLVVKLGLDAAEYTRGLTKAEYQAQQFAQNTRAAILEVGKVLGGLEIGRQLIESTKAIIEQAASLNDLADATGSSVEALSRLSNQAQIAGTDFNTLQTLVLKLAAGMSGADEESSKVGAALRFLGVTAKDPAEALQQVAISLNKYADGVGKAGIAVALFGKQGPAFLATLKDIAELQDVGATVSAKQAAEAENLQKAFRRLSVESRGFANTILNDVVPSLTSLIKEINETIAASGGLGKALLYFGTTDMSKLDEKIGSIKTQIDALRNGEKFDPFGLSDKSIQYLEGQLKALETVRKRQLVDESQSQFHRSGIPLPKPEITGFNPPKAGGSARALKETVSEAQRYLESLEKSLERTQELTTVEQFLRDVQMDRIKGLTPGLKDQILATAQQIDQAKELAKEQENAKRLAEEESRIRARNSQEVTRGIEASMQEAKTIREQNEGLREQLEFLKNGEEGLRAYTDAKLAKIITEKEDLVASLANVEGTEKQVAAIRESIAALRERQNIFKETDMVAQMKKEAQAMQDVKNMISDTFADAFADFVTGTKSAKDAFKSFVDTLSQQITRIASQNLANAIFGGTNSAGPDIFGVIGKLFGGFGGSSSVGLPFISGPQFGMAASGTNFAWGGPTLVGERGPELVNLPRGARVVPNNRLSDFRGGDTYVQNIQVPPRAPTQTIRHAAKQGWRAASGSARRG